MGTWGTGIFADDVASDLKQDYRAMLESGVDDAQAMRDVLDAYGTDETVVWLALAAVQSKLGRLDETVLARAVEIIDTGEDLALWEETEPADRRSRARALLKLRQTITGPQPPRRLIKPKWRHHTDLRPGDVLTITVNDVASLWVVLDVKPDRFGTHPWIRRLQHADTSRPSAAEVLQGIQRSEIVVDPDWEEIWAVRLRRSDPDWPGSGFSRLTGSAPELADCIPRGGYVGITWVEIVDHLKAATSPFAGFGNWDELGFDSTLDLET